MKTRMILIISCLSLTAACAGVPKVTVPESEYLDLQRQVRVLSKERDDLKADYNSERGENLLVRTRIRNIEHPMTAAEEAKRNRGESDKDLRDRLSLLEAQQAAAQWCRDHDCGH